MTSKLTNEEAIETAESKALNLKMQEAVNEIRNIYNLVKKSGLVLIFFLFNLKKLFFKLLINRGLIGVR